MPHVDQQRVCKYNINIRTTVLKFSRCQQRRRNNATETCVKHLANSKVIPIIHIRWWLSLQVQILISDLFFIYHSWKDGKWNSNLRSITFKLIETVLRGGINTETHKFSSLLFLLNFLRRKNSRNYKKGCCPNCKNMQVSFTADDTSIWQLPEALIIALYSSHLCAY